MAPGFLLVEAGTLFHYGRVSGAGPGFRMIGRTFGPERYRIRASPEPGGTRNILVGKRGIVSLKPYRDC